MFVFLNASNAFPQSETINITWFSKPVNMQLFARDANDSADIVFSGIVHDHGYYNVTVELFRNDIPVKTLSEDLNYSDEGAEFSITHRIRAELAEYKTIVRLRSYYDTHIIAKADSLVAGDVYIIAGQSNAQTADTNMKYSNEYCRTFGVQTDSTNQGVYKAKDTLWARSSANYNGFSNLNVQQPLNVCVWGMALQKMIKEDHGIPTCVINGAVHSTSITQHLRNDTYPQSFNSIYGRILYRAVKSQLADKIKAIIWYQGEKDLTYPQNVHYKANFEILYNMWKEDFPSVEMIYLFQTRPLSCGASDKAMELRETQRKFRYNYDNVEVLSSSGISLYQNCHFHYTGYLQLADILYKRINGYFYGSTDTINTNPPSIRNAFFVGSTRNRIAMLFDGSVPAAVPSDTLGNSIKNAFFINKLSMLVSSVTKSGDTLFLNLTAPFTQPANISYVPNQFSVGSGAIYNGPWIRNHRGIAALTFDQIEVLDQPPVPDMLLLKVSLIRQGLLLNQHSPLTKSDSAVVYLNSSVAPYEIIDSAWSKIDSISYTGIFQFRNALPGRYYLSVSGMNMLTTWGSEFVHLIEYNNAVSYSFTESGESAFGNNLIKINGKFCTFSGDLNHSGRIDLNDLLILFNDMNAFAAGSSNRSDINGDGIVNLTDLTIILNNSEKFVTAIYPN